MIDAPTIKDAGDSAAMAQSPNVSLEVADRVKLVEVPYCLPI